MENSKNIFGPINSRRFGVSLGVDLSSKTKQCNFDCLYCELAPAKTTELQEYTVDSETIFFDIHSALKTHKNIDVITFTANGEPTLYPYLNELIEKVDTIKGDTQTLILTNSATLMDEQVFNTLLLLDQVKLSLDAITPEVFKKIDRPHESIKIEKISQKVIEFSNKFKGKLFIEILFVHTLNDSDEEIKKLNEVLLEVKCDRIDLGTIDRPPAYNVTGISYSELHSISMKFDSSLPVHIASRQHAESCKSYYSNEEILNTLDKRPLSQEDIELLFDDDSQKRVEELKCSGSIKTLKRANIEFFIKA
ncbi:MAG: radical SAM protein [Helicobacteraceae bacterium]|nr:radical SAM protein [Helicobacteraceae bacterium]